MNQLAVITPSFRGDLELFADLHRSVLEFTPTDTVHHVFVPPGDRKLFAGYAGPRCRVWTSGELLPRRYVRTGRSDFYVNARRPFPPVSAPCSLMQCGNFAATSTLAPVSR